MPGAGPLRGPFQRPGQIRSVRGSDGRSVERGSRSGRLDPVQQGLTGWDMDAVKAEVAASGLSTSDLLSAAWSSTCTFCGSDLRGGANRPVSALTPRRTGSEMNRTGGPAYFRSWSVRRRVEPIAERLTRPMKTGSPW